MTSIRNMNKGLLMIIAGILAVNVAQAAHVITRQGKRIDGSGIRAKSNGDVILQTDRGPLTFSKGSYVEAVADEPPEYKKAMRLAAAGRYDDSAKLLRKIVSSFGGLQWDNKARVALAKVQFQKKDYDAARTTYDELFRAAPASKEDEDILWDYREALLYSGKTAILEPQLNKVIQSSSREDAARAQIMRGDIRNAQGQLEPAVFDYMRTMVFFKDVPEYQPEAMYKAAEGLEKMRDDRAKKIYKDLVSTYPDSPYARQAQGKL